MKDEPYLTVIIPCYNEEQIIESTVSKIHESLLAIRSYEILAIDDGSSDKTWEKLLNLTSSDKRVVGIRLSRNFGHQAAIIAGLAHSKGKLTAVLDADLQDPPSVLVKMIKLLEQKKVDVVFGVRKARRGINPFLKMSYKIFYKTFAYLTGLGEGLQVGDFRVMNRRIVDRLNNLTETDKFIRGLVPWLGFKQVGFDYIRPPRRGGSSKYKIKGLIELAISGITSFSILPLRTAILCAFLSAGLAILFAIWAVIDRYLVGSPPAGWTSIIVLILTMGSFHFLLLGVIGEYLGKIFLQTKNRPAFIVSEKTL